MGEKNFSSLTNLTNRAVNHIHALSLHLQRESLSFPSIVSSALKLVHEKNMSSVHPTSILHETCVLGQNVEIGPYCCIGPDVTVGDGTRLISNVTIIGSTSLGKDCTVFPYASLGAPGQTFNRPSEDTRLVIGDKTVIREFVSIHTGTCIGQRCLIMTNVHIGHDCELEDNVTIVAGAGLAGHVFVESYATIAGMVGVHQWNRIGRLAYVGGGSMVTRDVLPFSTVLGDRAKTVGINTEGLMRQGWTSERISTVANAVRGFLTEGEGGLQEALERSGYSSDILSIVEFVKVSSRGVCASRSGSQSLAHGL